MAKKSQEVQELKEALAEAHTQFSRLSHDFDMLEENFSQIAHAYDVNGWKLLSGMDDTLGVPLDTLKRWATPNRDLVAINPVIKRASRIRVSYIFGEGVQFKNTQPRHKQFIKAHEETLFGELARQEMETAWNTDGQVFFLMNKAKGTIIRVPFAEITGIATDPDSSEKVLMIQRTWIKNGIRTPQQTQPGDQRVEWYPVSTLTQTERNSLPQKLESTDGTKEIPVSRDTVMLFQPVNKQVGWALGIADIQPVVFWVKAYKEFMEDNYRMVRSLARFTWKVTATTARGVNQNAMKLAGDVPAGSALSLGPHNDLVAVNKAGANVNFEVGKPLAALVAAGLEVPVDQMLATPGSSGEEKLDPPTHKAMMSRQEVVKSVYAKAFSYMLGESAADSIQVVMPPIQSEPIHRVIQAIVTAATTNGIHPEEVREMLILVLRQLGIDPLVTLPEPGAWAKFVGGVVNKNPGTSPLNPPDGDKSGVSRSPAGALADGDHEQRASEMAKELADVIARHQS